MISSLRDFLNNLASAKLDPAAMEALTRNLSTWSGRLLPLRVDEKERMFGWLSSRPGRGQTITAPIVPIEVSSEKFRGTVTFGDYFAGLGGAVQSTAIPGVLDEILGRVVLGRSQLRARSAYLNVSFRSLTPVNEKLDVCGWIEREEGRKIFVGGHIALGEVVCAEAEGLFIALRDDQL
jgi:hypothetical protein